LFWYCRNRVLWIIWSGWLWTSILLRFTSQVFRITGMSHRRLASKVNLSLWCSSTSVSFTNILFLVFTYICPFFQNHLNLKYSFNPFFPLSFV
jgi:hypothetical protein